MEDKEHNRVGQGGVEGFGQSLREQQKEFCKSFANIIKKALEEFRLQRDNPRDDVSPLKYLEGLRQLGILYFNFSDRGLDDLAKVYRRTITMVALEKLFRLGEDYDLFIETGKSKLNPNGYNEGPYGNNDMAHILVNPFEYDKEDGTRDVFYRKVCELVGIMYEELRPRAAARWYKRADEEKYKDKITELETKDPDAAVELEGDGLVSYRRRVYEAVREFQTAGNSNPLLKVDVEANLEKVLAMAEDISK